MSPLYKRWLRYVFDRPPTANGWYFDLDLSHFEASADDLTTLITLTCSRSGTDLLKFDDRQVYEGLDFIFNNSCSNTVFALKDQSVGLDKRIQALRSMRTLYLDCFAKRCDQAVSHLDEGSNTRLNSICYMLWDVTPLSYWEGHPDRDVFYVELVQLLGAVLRIRHVACVESALHGLGHIQPYASQLVERELDGWAASKPSVPTTLIEYAEQARRGCVQ